MTDLDGQARTGQVDDVGAERIRRARLAVADHSTDPADCLLLLDILGLLPEPPDPSGEPS